MRKGSPFRMSPVLPSWLRGTAHRYPSMYPRFVQDASIIAGLLAGRLAKPNYCLPERTGEAARPGPAAIVAAADRAPYPGRRWCPRSPRATVLRVLEARRLGYMPNLIMCCADVWRQPDLTSALAAWR